MIGMGDTTEANPIWVRIHMGSGIMQVPMRYGDDGGDMVELYGARGTAPKSSSSTLFDDYGRSISVPSRKTTPVSSNKIVRAVPKADTQEDAKSGVQKFRVKLLAESGGQSTMDVLCQLKEMGGRIRPTESVRPSEPSTERKKGLTD
ncbi:unnamed protein product [Malus baccata var. baccata]